MFIDRAKIQVKAGNGGNGCNSYFRDNRVEHGKPNGGDGGKGGDVILLSDKNLFTLMDFQYQRHFEAGKGKNGSSNNKTGARGEDFVVRVPVGTIVRDVETGCMIRDLDESDVNVVVAKGGRGGAGNDRAREAQAGELGEVRELELNLKLIADVGIIGFPNAGKSTLISKISNATPKIASYPFTTKAPILGVVRIDEDRFFIVADIPGLIEGAHEGKGLGDTFLKHVERTKVLIHVVDMAGVDGRDPLEDYKTINKELGEFSKDLSEKPQILVANKMDLPAAGENLKRFRKKYRRKIIPVCAMQSQGLEDVIDDVSEKIAQDRR